MINNPETRCGRPIGPTHGSVPNLVAYLKKGSLFGYDALSLDDWVESKFAGGFEAPAKKKKSPGAATP